MSWSMAGGDVLHDSHAHDADKISEILEIFSKNI